MESGLKRDKVRTVSDCKPHYPSSAIFSVDKKIDALSTFTTSTFVQCDGGAASMQPRGLIALEA